MTMPAPADLPLAIVAFDGLIDRVRALMPQIRESARRVVAAAVRASRLLPGVLAGQLIGVAEDLVRLVRRLDDLIARLLELTGRPDRLWRAGRLWVEAFAGPLSGLAGKIHPDHLAAGYHWEGRAAEAYEAAADRQRTALVTLAGIGVDANVALGRLALGICGAWAAIAAMLASATVQLAGAAIAAGTGAGAPVAVALAAASIATVCAGVASAVGVLMAVLEWVNDALATLTQRLADATAFPDGAWPGPHADRFRDGTLTDGTPSDWRLPT